MLQIGSLLIERLAGNHIWTQYISFSVAVPKLESVCFIVGTFTNISVLHFFGATQQEPFCKLNMSLALDQILCPSEILDTSRQLLSLVICRGNASFLTARTQHQILSSLVPTLAWLSAIPVAWFIWGSTQFLNASSRVPQSINYPSGRNLLPHRFTQQNWIY